MVNLPAKLPLPGEPDRTPRRQPHVRRTAAIGGAVLLLSFCAVQVVPASAAGAGSLPAGTRPRAVALPSRDYQLSVGDGRVWLSWPTTGDNCLRRAVGPTNLELGQAQPYGCSGFTSVQGDPNARLQLCFKGNFEVRAVITNPLTGKPTAGPMLGSVQYSNWAHSGMPVFGGGYIWAYDLKQKPGPQLLEISATSGRLVHRMTLEAGTDPFLAYNADGLWVAESAWAGPSCPSACPLWHVAPGASRATVALRAGVADQWFTASASSVFADVLSRIRSGPGTARPSGASMARRPTSGTKRPRPFCRHLTSPQALGTPSWATRRPACTR